MERFGKAVASFLIGIGFIVVLSMSATRIAREIADTIEPRTYLPRAGASFRAQTKDFPGNTIDNLDATRFEGQIIYYDNTRFDFRFLYDSGNTITFTWDRAEDVGRWTASWDNETGSWFLEPVRDNNFFGWT